MTDDQTFEAIDNRARDLWDRDRENPEWRAENPEISRNPWRYVPREVQLRYHAKARKELGL